MCNESDQKASISKYISCSSRRIYRLKMSSRTLVGFSIPTSCLQSVLCDFADVVAVSEVLRHHIGIFQPAEKGFALTRNAPARVKFNDKPYRGIRIGGTHSSILCSTLSIVCRKVDENSGRQNSMSQCGIWHDRSGVRWPQWVDQTRKKVALGMAYCLLLAGRKSIQ